MIEIIPLEKFDQFQVVAQKLDKYPYHKKNSMACLSRVLSKFVAETLYQNLIPYLLWCVFVSHQKNKKRVMLWTHKNTQLYITTCHVTSYEWWKCVLTWPNITNPLITTHHVTSCSTKLCIFMCPQHYSKNKKSGILLLTNKSYVKKK